MKRTFSVLLLTSALLLGGCSFSGETDMVSTLSSIDGVTSVEKIEVEEAYKDKNPFPNAYLLKFETPIDWHNKDLGTFQQRVYLGYRGKDKVSTYQVGGYALGDAADTSYFQKFSERELSSRYQGNFINIEYRFFHQSRPEDFSNTGTKYLDYLNSEEACKDFHNIVTKLSTVLTGKKIFTGASKGGYTTETMAYYYPDDIDAFVSYVAPFCDGIYDTRFYDNVFTTIGDGGLGKEEAAKKRELMFSFSKAMVEEESRATYLDWLQEDIKKKGVLTTGRFTLDEFWEASAIEANATTWQYDYDFSLVEEIMKMSETSEEEKLSKQKAIYDYVVNKLDMFSGIDMSGYAFPYYFQAYSEMGNYCYEFDYLRNAGCYITTTKEEEKDLFLRSVLTEEQQNYITYSPAMRNRMIDFFKTTTKDIIKIEGYNDTWYAVAAPEVTNSHVHLFKVNGCHKSTINALNENDAKTCWDLIDGLVK